MYQRHPAFEKVAEASLLSDGQEKPPAFGSILKGLNTIRIIYDLSLTSLFGRVSRQKNDEKGPFNMIDNLLKMNRKKTTKKIFSKKTHFH